MDLNQRINAVAQLGVAMGALASEKEWPGYDTGLSKDEFDSFQGIMAIQYQYNGWFTPENVRKSLANWSDALNLENLTEWLSRYDLKDGKNEMKKVGIICAGNLPLVGLHDILTVLLTGNIALIKLSSDDNHLIPALLQTLVKFNPEFETQIEYMSQKMVGHHAVIATGSNNTSRYFEYYFRDIPHIIRRSRTSVAVLDGSETAEELKLLGNDVFDYFGLGCRNVSKIFLPKGYDLNNFFQAIYDFHPIINHHKYANNYDYNKAVWMLNGDKLLDNGFILLKEEDKLASPTASLYYEFYENSTDLNEKLSEMKSDLQCIVSRNHIPFGNSQKPMLWEYADGVDTVGFLSEIR